MALNLIRQRFTAGTKLSVDGALSVDGLMKASYENGKYIIAATETDLESSDVGVSILQEVPFDGTKQVVSMFLASDLASNVSVTTWVKNQPSFTPQRKLQFAESTTTCNDPLVTFPVEITFEGDYDSVVKGKEQEFQSHCESKLSELYPDATITNCRVRKGSIIASFNMSVPASKSNETVDKLWEDVKEGLKLEFDGATLTTLPIMKVGSETRKVEEKEPVEEDRMPVYIIVVAYTVEPAFEEIEEQLPESQSPRRSKEDSADLPKPVLAFAVASTKQPTPNPSPNVSRGQTPVASSSGSLQLSDPGDKSPIRDTPEVVPTSSQTRLQSPAESVPASESTEALEDEFDDDEIESLRQEAVLRRRASSIDADHEQNMPGVLVFTDLHTKRRTMQVKVIRPNPELGILAHMAGVVKVNPSGTLGELRQDINRSLPGYLGSVRYLLLSRKFEVIDPRTENQLIVSGMYKKTIYVKVFHGADNCEYFCLCGKAAYEWCPKCNVQGYCGEECRAQDEEEHAKICSKSKTKVMQSARTRRVSRESKF
ncbi:hypothetical protein ACROYT_G038868 [Oculina patagonica]